ncbi:hypothetical protein HOU02_gp207 [Caulobacter phage CcrBL9]|uniref:Uncharacterized protein n=1 Tax=Caulobacter phage CcrBL9 TaxID=2283270 RepID=A0A385EFH5_9CAUD|nr:hypothetical protein HOU02_gp207 [Caulobacter phage CcrBL9]AXQ69518.1 hypothetical protein CcrBL9_gp494 [Caulobacter phage CcrBL9]
MTTRRDLFVSGLALAAASASAIPGMAAAKALKNKDDFDKRVLDVLAQGAATGGGFQQGLDQDVADYLVKHKLAFGITLKSFGDIHVSNPAKPATVDTYGPTKEGLQAGNIVLADRLSPDAGAMLRKAFATRAPASETRRGSRAEVERRLYAHLTGRAFKDRLPVAPLVLNETSHRQDFILAGLEQGSLRPASWSGNSYTEGGVLWVERTPTFLIGLDFSYGMTWEIDKVAMNNDIVQFQSLPSHERDVFTRLVSSHLTDVFG